MGARATGPLPVVGCIGVRAMKVEKAILIINPNDPDGDKIWLLTELPNPFSDRAPTLQLFFYVPHGTGKDYMHRHFRHLDKQDYFSLEQDRARIQFTTSKPRLIRERRNNVLQFPLAQGGHDAGT